MQHFITKLIRPVQLLCLGVFVLVGMAWAQEPEPQLSTQLNPDVVIARTGDIKVTVGDYLAAAKAYFNDPSTRASYKEQDEKSVAEYLVRSIVDRRVRARVMSLVGYDQQPLYQSSVKFLQWRHLAEIASESLPPFTEKDLTEADLRKAYEDKAVKAQNTGISFRFIFIRTLDLDEEATQAKRTLAEKTLERVRGGEDFIEVMKDVSEVAEKRDRPYWVHEHSTGFDPRIYELLSQMEAGEISSVVTTKAGLFILRRFSNPKREAPKPFDEIMADADSRRRLGRDALQHLGMNKKNWLYEKIKTRYEAGAIATTDLTTLKTLGDDTLILKIGEETLTLCDLKVGLKKKLEACSIEDINTTVEALSKQMIFAQYTREKGLRGELEALPEYQRDLSTLQDRYMMFTSRSEVPDMSEEEMQAFYDEHRTAFRESCRANARQLYVKPKGDPSQKEILSLVVRDEAQRLKGLIEQGQTFDQLAQGYQSERFAIDLKRWDDQTPNQIAFADGTYGLSLLDELGQVKGPERVQNGFVLYALVEKLPGKIMAFEQTRSLINDNNKKTKAQEKINAVFEKQLKDLEMNESLLYIPADLIPKR